jgi:hypothetical protein
MMGRLGPPLLGEAANKGSVQQRQAQTQPAQGQAFETWYEEVGEQPCAKLPSESLETSSRTATYGRRE